MRTIGIHFDGSWTAAVVMDAAGTAALIPNRRNELYRSRLSLDEIRTDAERLLGAPPDAVIAAVPASWGLRKRHELVEEGRRAALPVLSIVAESVGVEGVAALARDAQQLRPAYVITELPRAISVDGPGRQRTVILSQTSLAGETFVKARGPRPRTESHNLGFDPEHERDAQPFLASVRLYEDNEPLLDVDVHAGPGDLVGIRVLIDESGSISIAILQADGWSIADWGWVDVAADRLASASDGPPEARYSFGASFDAIGVRSRVRGREGDADPIDCTVFAPEIATPGEDALVQVFLHLDEEALLVGERATEADRDARRAGGTTLAVDVERGTRLVIALAIGDLVVDEPLQQLVWHGRASSVQFAVNVPAARSRGSLAGRVSISADDVPLGTIRFKLAIGSAAPVEPSAHRYRRAFLSYASPDRDEVLKRAQMLGRCGISFFQDVLDLEPGERWQRRLLEEIDRCDLFLLFWSSAARDSDWVGREVRHALARKRGADDAPPEIIPILVEGPPVPPPPPELAHLHFNEPLLHFLRR